MARYLANNPRLVEFGLWLSGRLTVVDIRLIETMSRVCGLDDWTIFEAATKKYANEYARVTEGGIRLMRLEHYRAAGETLCEMAKDGRLIIDGVDFDAAKHGVSQLKRKERK